jgi:transcriptional regulator with XRE-family HTH domain
MDNTSDIEVRNPGVELSIIRQQKGYSIEYVANKLHLRARVIELIEQGGFDLLPEPVFVKGYLRAYAKLLGISPDPFLSIFNAQLADDKKPERALWQSKRESHKAEHFIRWFTIAFAIAVMVAIGLWWHNNRDHPIDYALASEGELFNEVSLGQLGDKGKDIKLTDVSRMHALLNPALPMSPMENAVD